MPNLILALEVDRVDLVDEGANSEAYIELYKRKESPTAMDLNEILAKMKPEHREVVEAAIAKANEDNQALTDELTKAKTTIGEKDTELAKAKEDLAEAKADSGVSKTKDTELTEEVLKSMDPAIAQAVRVMKAKADAAEAAARELSEKALNDEAIAKAKELKNIPVDEAQLVTVLKTASGEVVEILKAANAAIEAAPNFGEVGKSRSKEGASTAQEAWSKIEKKAEEIEKRDSVTKAKAIKIAINENKDLYREYLAGGAN